MAKCVSWQEGSRKKDSKSVQQLWDKALFIGGISEGCSPRGQNWKPCGREVKTRNRQLSKKTGWKGKKRSRAEARGRSGMEVGFFKMGDNCSY